MSKEVTLDLVGLTQEATKLATSAAIQDAENNIKVKVNDIEYVLIGGRPIDVESFLVDQNRRRDWERKRDLEPEVPCHDATTLTAVVDFAGVVDAEVYVTAASRTVCLYRTAPRFDGNRDLHIRSMVPECKFRFGYWYAPEDFVPAVLAGFLDSGEKERLLELFHDGLQIVDVSSNSTDGVSQTVTMERRTGLRDNVPIDNRFTLRALRTFREIDQPAGIFTLQLRMDGDKLMARLYEVDSEAWKLEAVSSIKTFLREAGLDESIPIVG